MQFWNADLGRFDRYGRSGTLVQSRRLYDFLSVPNIVQAGMFMRGGTGCVAGTCPEGVRKWRRLNMPTDYLLQRPYFPNQTISR